MLEPPGDFKARGRPFDFAPVGLKPARDAAGGGDPFLDRHSLDLPEKIGVPDGPAVLPIGDALQTDLLLHPDQIADAPIFDLPEPGGGYFAIAAALARLQEFLRAQ